LAGLERSFMEVGGRLRDALFLAKMPIRFPKIVRTNLEQVVFWGRT